MQHSGRATTVAFLHPAHNFAGSWYGNCLAKASHDIMSRRNTEPDTASSYRERLQFERHCALRELRSSRSLVFPRASATEDQAAQAHDQFVATHQETIARQKLQDIDAALARLETGEYGSCQECDEPISGKRLNAIPWASRCVACQEELSARTGAKNEEWHLVA
jgi:DnaK suppressor protein